MNEECVPWKALIDTIESKQTGLFEKGRDKDADSAHTTIDYKDGSNIAEHVLVELTPKERMRMRLSPMDNIRTTAIFLLVIQYAMIGAISSHPYVSELEDLARGSYTTLTTFVAMAKLITVPILFFVSGFSSRFSLEMHSRSVIHFLLRKTFRTVLAVAAYQGVARFSKFFHGSLPEFSVITPYYASQEGRDALLNGPAFYVLAVLVLDYIYAVCWSIKKLVIGNNHLINNQRRFALLKYAIVFLLTNLVILRATGLVPHRLPGTVHKWLYLINSPELHFPFVYLIAYLAGVQFTAYYNFVFKDHRKRHGLILSIALSAFGLSYLYYRYPDIISQFLDIRNQPPLTFITESTQPWWRAPSATYATWVVYSILLIGEGLIAAFFTNTKLMANWGSFSCYSYIQVYAQLFFVGGSSMKFLRFYTDNVLIQALATAFLSLCSGYCLQIIVHSWWITDEDDDLSGIEAK